MGSLGNSRVNGTRDHHVNGVYQKDEQERSFRNSNGNGTEPPRKKHILLNAFDMSSTLLNIAKSRYLTNATKQSGICRLDNGRIPKTGAQPKPVSSLTVVGTAFGCPIYCMLSSPLAGLDYWINLAKILESGDINALFLADTYGGYDTYEGKLDDCIRRAAQWPMTDPTIPISAMAAVTKNLAFGITASTSFEPPFLLAKRFATLDHMTNGRIGWNIVTGYKKAAFKAIGIDTPIEHDERYNQA